MTKTFPIKHCAKKPVTTMLTYPWTCTVLHCNYLRNTWKPLVLMTQHFDYCPSTSEGDNQSARSSAPVVSRCFPGGYSLKLYMSRGRLAWWLLAFLCCGCKWQTHSQLSSPRGVLCELVSAPSARLMVFSYPHPSAGGVIYARREWRPMTLTPMSRQNYQWNGSEFKITWYQ